MVAASVYYMKLKVTMYFKKKNGCTYLCCAPTGFAAYLLWEKMFGKTEHRLFSCKEIYVFLSTDKLKSVG